ncbi:MAG: repeat-containing protein, partial [Enterovirga sp.]|nr:repeat-containing protein [Enterovirga sp.]
MKGHARIEFRFDEPAKVRVRSTNGVIVVTFDAPARIVAERLAAELAPYLSAVRRDPDGTGLRLALVSPVRTNLLEAGERTFLDLLPPNWNGLPPGLPPQVVAELAERARVAEARIRAEAERRAVARPPVTLRVAELPTLSRLVFEPPAGTRARWRIHEGAAEITFEGPHTLDLAGARPKGVAGVAEFLASPGGQALTVRVTAQDGFDLNGFLEGESVVIDLSRPGPEPAAPPALAPRPPARPSKAETPTAHAPAPHGATTPDAVPVPVP